jgi:hypothetical protein
VLQDHDASPEPAGRNLPAAHALVRRRTRDAEQCRNLGDCVGSSAVGHHFRSRRRNPGIAVDSARRENRPGCCSDDRCAVHGADRAQTQLIESLPRPHTRSLPPASEPCGMTTRITPFPRSARPQHTRPLTRAADRCSPVGLKLPAIQAARVRRPRLDSAVGLVADPADLPLDRTHLGLTATGVAAPEHTRATDASRRALRS